MHTAFCSAEEGTHENIGKRLEAMKPLPAGSEARK